MKKFNILCILFVQITLISAIETLDYRISYLGVCVADVEIVHSSQNKTIDVLATSSGFSSIFQSMKNYYSVNYKSDFIPKTYRKITDQADFFENLTMTYSDNNQACVIDSLKNESRNYDISPNNRDFFSALFFLRFTEDRSGEIYLDAREVNWKASFSLEKTEDIEVDNIEYHTNMYKITFEKLSDKKAIRSDIFTNNLVNEDNILYFWITNDSKRIPIIAKYKMKPFSVMWTLKNGK